MVFSEISIVPTSFLLDDIIHGLPHPPGVYQGLAAPFLLDGRCRIWLKTPGSDFILHEVLLEYAYLFQYLLRRFPLRKALYLLFQE